MITTHAGEQQIIYEGTHTIVKRQLNEQAPSQIIKSPQNIPTIYDISRYKNEFKLLQKIKSPYIVQVIDLIVEENRLELILQDDNAISLQKFLQKNHLTLHEKLHIMIQMTNAITKIHQHKIIYKDVNPSNFIILPKTKQLKIIDFGIASELLQQSQQTVSPTLLEGTIAYMSPEQTGRMNRSIDYRTDIYSLGVTFYEILTNQLPFMTSDTMELIHCHLAMQPTPPSEIINRLPIALSNIVMKCLAKNAEDRYNSASGLLFDLQHCLNQLENNNEINPFVLAKNDEPLQFQLIQKQYGRRQEIQQLMECFSKVSRGEKVLVEISGYSGIGKTALVHELYKPLIKEQGLFVAGKCEQYKRNQPYHVLIQALKQLIQIILTADEETVNEWREIIHSAIIPNGQLIIDVIPELEHIIGTQPPVKQLPQLEASQRFHLVFQNFLTCFTNKEQPLVLFLDDLQWIDSASLQFLQSFLLKPNISHLLVISSYRNNEMPKTHPYFYLVEHLLNAQVDVCKIVLRPLEKKHIHQMLTDSSNFDEEVLQQIVDFVYSKTEGNPYFTNQLLLSLYEEQILYFDKELQCYTWRPERISSIKISDNIVDLMLQKIQKLPLPVQQTLKFAAAISNTIDVNLVAIACEQSKQQTIDHLVFAFEQGLIVPSDVTYQALRTKELLVRREPVQLKYKFAHDRIQQAAYSLIGEQQLNDIHLHIGQLLYKSCNPQQFEEQLFAITDHFNIGINLLDDEQSKLQLAQLNVRAAIKAKASVAYDVAIKYLENAVALTQLRYFDSHYNLLISIVKELMECYFMTHNSSLAEKYFNIYLQHAKTNVEKAEAYYFKTLILQNDFAYEAAIDASIEGLKLLGIKIPKRFINLNVAIELLKTIWQYKKVNVEQLSNLPVNKDRAAEIASMLAVSLANNTYFVNVQQGFIGVLKMNQRSLKEGNTNTSAFTYLSYAIATNTIFGNYTKGHRLGLVAMELIEKLDDPLSPRNYFAFATGVNHWHKHIKTNREYTLKGYHTAIETGDIIYIGYNASLLVEEMLYYGEQLNIVEEELLKYKEYLNSTLNKTNEEMFELFHNYIQTLQGYVNDETSIIGNRFDEEQFLNSFGPPTNVFRYYIAKMDLYLLFDEPQKALDVSSKAHALRHSSMGQLRGALYSFYHFLSVTANFHTFHPIKMHLTSFTLKSIERKFARLAKHCPENFEHQHQLLCAELARVHKMSEKAFRHYDKAIRIAKQNGYTYHQARANELAGQFALQCQNTKLSQLYLQDAYSCYQAWGAKKKLEQLTEKYGDLLTATSPYAPKFGESKIRLHTNNSTNSEQLSQLDVTTILKASQAISNEIKLDNLIQQLMQNVMENAGAEKGLLFMPHKKQWRIEAISHLGCEQVHILHNVTGQEYDEYATTLFQYVRRTKKSVVLHDASLDDRFGSDPYVLQSEAKSLLCMPILYQHQLVAILYLENNLAPYIFTNDRIELLNILSSQAAISISNARLYETLDEQVKARTEQLEQTLYTLQETQDQLVEAEKFSSLGNLVAGVAHEINTPIGVSVTAVSHLHDKTDEFGKLFEANQIKKSTLEKYLQQVQETSQMISTNLQRASDLIRSFKQVAVDQSTDIKRELHLKSYLEETLLSLKPNFKNKPVTINVVCPDDYKLLSNAGAISQIFTNLIVNALIHAFKDGRTGHISIHVEPSNQQLSIRFIDNGCGMSEEIRSKIFEPFFTTNRANGGTGLGMHIVYNIVTQTLSGTISCESKQNEGTTFTIIIPTE